MSTSTAKMVVVLDANVLYPPLLRDVLVGLAAAGLYKALWSSGILGEVERNLAKRMGSDVARRHIKAMRSAIPGAEVSGYEREIGNLRNDPKDRHVAAAAIKGKATVIVTANLRDFVPLPSGLTAMNPDDFLCLFVDDYSEDCWKCLEEVRLGWPEPPEMDSLLQNLGRFAETFVLKLQENSLNA